MTLRTALESNAAKTPEKVYFYFGELTHTYAEMNGIANRLANAMMSLGMSKGDTLGMLLTNVPEFVYCMYGAGKAGFIFCPINPALRADEATYIINNSEAKVLVVEAMFLPMIRAIRAQCPGLKCVVVVGDGAEGDELKFKDILEKASSDSPAVNVSPDDPASIIYTSGTTGKPKGAVLTHGNYIWDAMAVSEYVNMTPDDRFMCILPLFHVNGQVVTTLAPMVNGASMVLVNRFSATTFFQTVDRYKPTAFSAVPTIYAMLLNTPGTEGYDLSSLRFCICGAAPMPVQVFEAFEKKFNARILEGYGLSEGTCASSVNPIDGKRKVGSIGLPLPGQEMKIVDMNNNDVAPGVTGEIVIKGPNVMKEYFRNPEATKDAIIDAWLHTGDLGVMDEEGFFTIVGRKKEMIIRGGENIYPKEIEEVLYRHPTVAEAAVCGVPDKFYGEEVKAFVVLKEGTTATDEELVKYCMEKLAKYKCPKSVQVISEMPKTATGKIQKRKLVEDPRWTAE